VGVIRGWGELEDRCVSIAESFGSCNERVGEKGVNWIVKVTVGGNSIIAEGGVIK